MSALAFLLGLAVTASALSWTAAGAVLLAAPVFGRLRLSSARRADAALMGGLLPVVAAGVGALLVALPAMLALTGVWTDHCVQHDHHWHLCPVHAVDMPIGVAIAGACVLVRAAVRVGQRVVDGRRERTLLQALAAVGERDVVGDIPVIVVDGPPTLLHAANTFIVASRALLDGVGSEIRAAALQHEAAHVRRRDSIWLRWLLLARAVSPPLFGAWVARVYRQAAEEAADEDAALVVGVVDVAAAIVAVSRLRAGLTAEALVAIDGANIERRVVRLLALRPERRSAGGTAVIALLIAGAASAVPFFDDVHHGAETVLAHVATTHRDH